MATIGFRLAAFVAVVALAPASADAEAEHYENVRLDLGLLGAAARISERMGSGISVEIKGLVNDHIAIGGRVEIAVMYGGVVGTDRARLNVAMVADGLLKAEYLFGNAFARPFIGFGVGGYTIGSQTIDAGPNRDAISATTGRYFGVAPQVGVDIGRIRLAATYNAILGAYLEVRETIGNAPQMTQLNQSYLSLEISFQLAGGRKSAPSTSPPALLQRTKLRDDGFQRGQAMNNLLHE